ncbi:hypothetical protein AVEN_120068-1 [Araneus ventricosus]|uniref:Reverse transcriptase domain-containing protein n=1 Tax=Araneus ventricosus TaxID=182803 RepID=A0A4Y2SRB5_ARAVE|nr:hypothetical protein AVEN_120068-1 [Araneus ventricosus]
MAPTTSSYRKFPFLLMESFNTCLKLAKFPDPLKVGSIILFHKHGKSQTEAFSYRHISLLPTIGRSSKIPVKDQRSGTENKASHKGSGLALWNLVANEILKENWPINTNIQPLADDFVLLSHALTRVQLEAQINQSIDKLSTYVSKTHLQISAEKQIISSTARWLGDPPFAGKAKELKAPMLSNISEFIFIKR